MYSQIGQTIDLLANLLILNAIGFIKIPFLLVLLRGCVSELRIELLLHRIIKLFSVGFAHVCCKYKNLICLKIIEHSN